MSRLPQATRSTTPTAARKPLILGAVCVAAIAVVSTATTWWVTRDATSNAAPAPSAADATATTNQTGADLLAMKADAETLAVAGRLTEAHAKYRQLLDEAARRDVRDPRLLDALDRARQDQVRIYAILLSQSEQQTLRDANAPHAPRPSPVRLATTPPVKPATPIAMTRPPVAVTAPTPATTATAPTASATTAPQVRPELASATTTAPAAPSTRSSASFHRIPTDNPPAAAEWAAATNAPVTPSALTDEQLDRAIHAAAGYLLAQFRAGEIARGDAAMNDNWRRGLAGLCVYALLEAHHANPADDLLRPDGPAIREALEKLRDADIQSDLNGRWEPVTYARSLRAMALASMDRREDRSGARDTLQDDAAWLAATEVLGGYTYDDRYAHGMHAPDPGTRSGVPSIVRGSIPPPGTGPGGKAVSTPPKNLGSSGVRGTPMPTNPPVVHLPPMPPIIIFIPPPTFRPPPMMPPRTTLPPPKSGGGKSSPPPSPGDGPGVTIIPQRIEDDPHRWADPQEIPWDNSNSEYGAAGMDAVANWGIEVPAWYWRDIQYHWRVTQLRDGTWGYRRGDPGGSFAMTCAGVVSLMTANEWIDAAAGPGTPPASGARDHGRDPFGPNVDAALAWLWSGDNGVRVGQRGSRFRGYDLYNLSRVGRTTGLKHLGPHDWFRELAADAVARQSPDGSWGGGPTRGAQDAIIDTAYTLLFLAQGRQPVILSKLGFDGSWANHPHDAANLARYASGVLERGVSWQVVGIERDWTDWLDAPVLYIASHGPVPLSDGDVDKLRHFADSGGTIFTQADDGADGFNKWVPDLARKLWPQYELKELPDDHEIYSVHTRLRTPHVKLSGVSNGARLLLVHSPGGLGQAWQARAEKSHADLFQLGMNVLAYATGKVELRHRFGNSVELTAPEHAAATKVTIARLRYDGNWDPEPMAWNRFSRSLTDKANVAVDTTPTDLADLKPGAATLAHLTGTAAFAPTEAQATAIRQYVEAGGVLLVDPCGGSGTFASAVEVGLIPAAFPGARVERLAADDPIFKATGDGKVDATKPELRPYAALGQNDRSPQATTFRAIRFGKGIVLFSRLDLTEGLLGTSAWGINGYRPASARDVVRNVVMWARKRT